MFRRVMTCLALFVAVGLVGVWWINQTHSWFQIYDLVDQELAGSRVQLKLVTHSDGAGLEARVVMPGSQFIDKKTWDDQQVKKQGATVYNSSVSMSLDAVVYITKSGTNMMGWFGGVPLPFAPAGMLPSLPLPSLSPQPTNTLAAPKPKPVATVPMRRPQKWYKRWMYVGGNSGTFMDMRSVVRDGEIGYLRCHRVSGYVAMRYPVMAVASLSWIGVMAAYGPVRRRWRRLRGRCVVCGYDLRASPGECPECGNEFRG